MKHSSRSLKVSPEKKGVLEAAVKRVGLSQAALGTEAGNIARSTIQKFLKGDPVDRSHFIDVCKVLGLEWEDLTGLKSLPPPSNLERSGAVQFVGREKLMNTLHDLLAKEGRVAITAIAGMAGVGKTELALQYGHRHLREQTYPGGICWFRARTPDSNTPDLGIQIINFAQTYLGLVVPEKSGEEHWSLKQRTDWCWRNWFPPDKQVLIILDDVPSYESIAPFLPPDETLFRVLITTRIQNIGGATHVIPIEPLELDASLQLLKSLVGKERVESELEQAQILCQWLGYLPLGLELVGRYLKRKEDLSLVEMYKRLEDKRIEQISLRSRAEGMTAQRNLLAAFELSWQELDEASQQLAFLLSLFAAAPIPWSLVGECLEEQDPETIEEIRDTKLVDLSLLKRIDHGIYVVHQLIRDLFRLKLNESGEPDKLRSKFCSALSRIAAQFPAIADQGELQNWENIIPHITEVSEVLNAWIKNEDLILPFCTLKDYYSNQCAYNQAVDWAEKCLNVAKKRLGEVHPAVASSLNNLGMLYYVQGRYTEADPLYVKAIEIRMALLQERDSDVQEGFANLAGFSQNLALLYQVQGRFDEAEALYKKSLEILYALLKEEDYPNQAIATSINNLAALYQFQGRYGEAGLLHLRDLEFCSEWLGEEHPSFATSLNNLAALYYTQRRYTEAELLYQEALNLREQLLGDTHPDVAISLSNLARLYQSQGRYAEAEPLCKEALDLLKQLFEDEHPDIAIALNTLAHIYHAQGRYSEAEFCSEEDLEICMRLWGEEHPDVATSLNTLASIYHAQNRDAEAKNLHERALRIQIRLLGENHPATAASFNSLAEIYELQGQYSEAEVFYKKAISVFYQILGEEYPDLITSLNNLGMLYLKQCRYSEAEVFCKEALNSLETLAGPEYPGVAIILNNLGLIYQAQEYYDEAELLFIDAVEILESFHGREHPDVASSLGNLAQLYQVQDRYDEALTFYKEALYLYISLLGEDHPRTILLQEIFRELPGA